MFQITKTKRKNACERLTSKPWKDFRVVGSILFAFNGDAIGIFSEWVFDVREVGISAVALHFVSYRFNWFNVETVGLFGFWNWSRL